jgi:hypothetical protein
MLLSQFHGFSISKKYATKRHGKSGTQMKQILFVGGHLQFLLHQCCRANGHNLLPWVALNSNYAPKIVII